ncbi:MAG: hypothetical protein WAN83_03750, partial [Candidatus Dormiibacterota bacterium]
GHFDRVASVVMSKNPRFHAGQGCRRDQIIAIRVRIPTMPPGHTEVEASTCSNLMPSTVLR